MDVVVVDVVDVVVRTHELLAGDLDY